MRRPPKRSRRRPPTPTGKVPRASASILTNQPGATSWPIAGATFILIHKQPQDPAARREALKFFAWAYAKGDKMAEDLDYVPMPDKVVGAIQKVWATEIKDAAASRCSRCRTDHRCWKRRRHGAFSLSSRHAKTIELVRRL